MIRTFFSSFASRLGFWRPRRPAPRCYVGREELAELYRECGVTSRPVWPRAEVVTVSCWQGTGEFVLRLRVDGERVNFTLADTDAAFLAAILPDSIQSRDLKRARLCAAQGARTNVQCDKSSGIDRSAGSQVEGQSP